MFYHVLVYSDDSPYYGKHDLQKMADEFNDDEDLNEEYRQSRMVAINDLIDYYTKDIKEDQSKLDKFKKLKAELDLGVDK